MLLHAAFSEIILVLFLSQVLETALMENTMAAFLPARLMQKV